MKIAADAEIERVIFVCRFRCNVLDVRERLRTPTASTGSKDSDCVTAAPILWHVRGTSNTSASDGRLSTRG